MAFVAGQVANPAGRPKGIANKTTQLQREIAERIFGKVGTPEFEAFIAAERKSLMDGTMPPQIKQYWLHCGYGKVVDRVEVHDVPPGEFETVDENELRARARSLAIARFAPVEEKESTIQ